MNSAHDSYTGAGGATELANMMTGEVIFGGVGSGLYGMLLMVLLAVFIAGLMVGRTPEYLGKKVEAREVKLVLVGVLVVPLLVLVATAIAIASEYGDGLDLQPRARTASRRPCTPTPRRATTTARRSPATRPSCSRTRPATPAPSTITFADLLGGVAMLVGRFVPLLAALAVAGSLSGKRVAPARPGHVPHRHAHLRLPADRRDRRRRRADVLPRLLLGPIVEALTTQLF